MPNSIPIAFITDENYVMPSCISIVSLLKNKHKNTKYKIFILVNNISDKSKNMLKQISLDNSELKIIVSDEIKELQNKFGQHRHVTKTSLLKFLLADLIDEDKLIFLDSDTFIRDDLTDMYNTDISNYYGAVVKDILSERGSTNHLKKMNFDNKFYFNSGVMLLNLNKMRQDNISKALFDYRSNKYNYFMDQDALNMVLGKKVKFLSYKYNFLNVYYKWWNSKKLSEFFEEKLSNNKVDVFKSVKILHFGGPDKPWEYDMGFLTEEFLSSYYVSPYKSEKPKLMMTPDYLKFWQSVFSVFKYKKHIIIVVLGMKLKIKLKT